jgi:hypothetical protein
MKFNLTIIKHVEMRKILVLNLFTFQENFLEKFAGLIK